MNSNEFLEMDPYKVVAQQGHVHPLVEDHDEDPKEDPSEEHEPEDDDDDEDLEEDPNEEHKPEDSDKTKPFEEYKIDVTPPPPRHRKARISVRPQTPMAASTQALIYACIAGSSPLPLPPISLAYDQASLGHRTAMIHMRDDIPEEVMPPQKRFVITDPPPGCDVAESSAVAIVARTPSSQYDFVNTIEHQSTEDLVVTQMIRIHALEARAQTDRMEDAIQRNSTNIQDDASQSSGGGLRRPMQPTRVCSYTDFMQCQPLNFKGTEGVVGLTQWLEKMESVFHISCCTIDNQVKFATCTLLGVALTWWNCYVRTLGHEAAYAMTWGTLKKKITDKYCRKELALMCTKFLADETKKVNKYISGLPDNIYGNRQNENKRKTDDSSRNNQQEPYKKQNVARAYTGGPGEKKRYGHTITDCRVNTNNNNNNRNQKARACYEYGNRGHIKRNCLKLKTHGNGNGNGVAQGRAYALGGRDASPNSNVITGTFILNNCYAKILFDTGAYRSFVSTTFSALINNTPTTLENHYDIELADGKIIREAKDKSEGKRLEDVPIVRDFPEVFPKDLLGIPPARHIEFQIDLVPGASLVARAPYRLAPSEMKELACRKPITISFHNHESDPEIKKKMR
nr:hypothetical protein [Tanacetum cinerariifolium]